MDISVTGPFTIKDNQTDRVILSGNYLRAVFSKRDNKMYFGQRLLGSNSITIKASGENIIWVNNRGYRNTITINLHKKGLRLINILELEEYIKGIAVREISHHWPMEALKAHCVVFRTYALYRKQESQNKPYDLTTDISTQSYGGLAAERLRINEAVAQTKDEILCYQGKILPAFYSSTCGGATEDAEAVWPKIKCPVLKAKECPYCKESPHYFWKIILTQENLIKAMKKAGIIVKQIKNIQVLSRNQFGRALSIRIIYDDSALGISASELRNLVGQDILKSTYFSVTIVDNGFMFKGFGWGHGVGMCQWGAYAMAKEGFSYRQILDFYYPNSEVKKLNSK
ncbi:MAG: SpoIID/LytB domain-containing protein [Candidatus Omnitrophica bacterium]|nr:SpoIID/LytB domain-containing protein [Candidatus Omnitrophota bacterium]